MSPPPRVSGWVFVLPGLESRQRVVQEGSLTASPRGSAGRNICDVALLQTESMVGERSDIDI
jgi:hypothetical protein